MQLCIMFAEKLNNVRGDLVVRVKVNEHLLSCMMRYSVIFRIEKNDIQLVSKCSFVAR